MKCVGRMLVGQMLVKHEPTLANVAGQMPAQCWAILSEPGPTLIQHWHVCPIISRIGMSRCPELCWKQSQQLSIQYSTWFPRDQMTVLLYGITPTRGADFSRDVLWGWSRLLATSYEVSCVPLNKASIPTQCWPNVGPASATLAQHCTSILIAFRVFPSCWYGLSQRDGDSSLRLYRRIHSLTCLRASLSCWRN